MRAPDPLSLPPALFNLKTEDCRFQEAGLSGAAEDPITNELSITSNDLGFNYSKAE